MNQSYVVMGGGNRNIKVQYIPRELLKLPNMRLINRLASPKEVSGSQTE